MELKLIINRFAETDGIDVPINVKTTFDDTGTSKILNFLSQLQSTSKNMRVSSVFSKMVDTKEAEKATSFMTQLRTSIKAITKEKSTKLIDPSGFETISQEFNKIKTSLSELSPDTLSKLVASSVSGTPIERYEQYITIMSLFKNIVGDTNEELGKTGKSAGKAGKGLGNLASVIRGSVLIQVQALAHVLRRAFNFMEQSFTAAGDFVESINLYTMSVGEYAEAGENWANKISDALYLDTSEIYQYTGQFFNLTRGLGATAKAADLMSRNLTQLSYDMASYLNIDVSVANNKLMSAMSGQTKAVTSVGIAVQAASLQELAYSLGIEKAVTEMTQAEKTYLRYIQIMRSTTQMQGDLGRTIITPTNAMRLLRTQLNLLSRAIGQVFTPIIMQTIPYIIAFTQILTELAQTLANMLGYKLSDYLAPADSVKALSDGFGDLEDSAKAAGDSINRTLAPFDELNVVQMESKGKGSDDTGSVLADLEQYLDGYDMLEFYTESMKDKIESIKQKIRDLLPVIAGIGAAFATWKAFKGFMKFLSLFAEGGTVAKGMSVISKLTGKITSAFGKNGALAKGITTLTKASGTLLGKFVGGAGLLVSLVTAGKSMGNLAKQTKDTTGNVIGFTASIAGAAASGFMIGGPIGALVGGLAGLTAGLVGFSVGLEALKWQQAKEDVFGTLNISVEQFSDMLNQASPAIGETSAKVEQLTESMKSNKESFDENLETVSTYLWRFGTLGQTITEEYSGQIMEAFNSLFENANQIVDEGTQRSVQIWTDALKSTTVITGEEQANILQMITDNGEFQKQEINEAQTRINEIYSTASNERRSLTQEEMNEIEELLQKIDELTRKQVSDTEAELYTMRQEFSNKNFELDEKSYDNYMKALDKYQEEKRLAINKDYLQALSDADYQAEVLYKRLLKQGVNEEEATRQKNLKLSELQGAALEQQQHALDEMDKYVESSKDELLKTLQKKYESLNKDTSDNANKQRKIIEGVFKKFDKNVFDDLKHQCQNEGFNTGNKFADEFLTAAQKKFDRNAFQFSIKSSGAKGYASGGFPQEGEFFMARENGPELVGRIGNRTAVANNDQITTAMTNAMVVALSGMNFNNQPGTTVVNIGGKKVFEGMGDYIDSENDRYGTNYVNV